MQSYLAMLSHVDCKKFKEKLLDEFVLTHADDNGEEQIINVSETGGIGALDYEECIAEVLETQSEIIQLQRNVIDRLAAALLQHSMIEEEELAMMQQAADLQRGIEE